MPGLGTVINTLAIIVGGLFGIFFGKLIGEKIRDSLCKACGVCVLFIGMSGAFDGMLEITDGDIVGGKSMLLVGCICVGTLIGEILNIEDDDELHTKYMLMIPVVEKDGVVIQYGQLDYVTLLEALGE